MTSKCINIVSDIKDVKLLSFKVSALSIHVDAAKDSAEIIAKFVHYLKTPRRPPRIYECALKGQNLIKGVSK